MSEDSALCVTDYRGPRWPWLHIYRSCHSEGLASEEAFRTVFTCPNAISRVDQESPPGLPVAGLLAEPECSRSKSRNSSHRHDNRRCFCLRKSESSVGWARCGWLRVLLPLPRRPCCVLLRWSRVPTPRSPSPVLLSILQLSARPGHVHAHPAALRVIIAINSTLGQQPHGMHKHAALPSSRQDFASGCRGSPR